MKNSYQACTLCPRNCHVNREQGERGYCRESHELRAARAALHFWEEPCISGGNGSGAIFFEGCSLVCVYCQNSKISRGNGGIPISVKRLAHIMLELQGQGANNINLVTPTHFVPDIAEAVHTARKNGLHLPIVYNTSGYEKTETLKLLEGIVDIYLPDFKYMTKELGQKFSHAENYADIAKEAVKEMVRQQPQAEFDKNQIMQKGVLVRHLILPGHTEESKKVVKYLYDTYGNQIYISLMNQYTPVNTLREFPELMRKLTKREYKKVVNYAIETGIVNGFIQEGNTAKESFIPAFTGEGVSCLKHFEIEKG